MVGRTRADETPQRREARLEAQRRYARHRRNAQRQAETEQQTLARLERQRFASRRQRETESAEQRQRRLSRQRDYDRRRRQTRAPQRTGNVSELRRETPTDEYDEYVRDETLRAITAQDAMKIEEKLRLSIGPYGLDECVCAVCDHVVLSKEAKSVHVTNSGWMNRMRVVLAPSDQLPQTLVEQYPCSDIDECLRGMLLSRQGIYSSDEGHATLMCERCHQHLSSHSDSPPKHAIANGFYIGRLPEELSDASWIEKVMVQLVTNVAQTRVMRGGQHRAIRSHCLVYEAIPGPPATILPRRVDSSGTYRVVLEGPRTAEQDRTIRKLHQARGVIVKKLLAFLKENNHFYTDTVIDYDSASADSAFDSIFVEETDLEIAERIDIDQASVIGHGDESAHSEEDECRIIERNVLLIPQDTVPDPAMTQCVIDLNSHEPEAEPRLRVQHSNLFAKGSDVEPRMFAHLFPFGRGHPAEVRKTPVSKSECIRHYLRLSSRMFARDSTFLLTAFSRLALDNMYTLTSLKCRRFPSLIEGFDAITKEDLAQALLNRERRHRGQSSVPLHDPTAERFLRSVELGAVAVWGSNAERRQCRKQAFAYQTLYGQPSLFVTLTPNSEGTFAMAHYAGILTVQSFFDYLQASVPSKADLRKAAMADDSASARLFMRLVDAFIADVLGVDPLTKRSSETPGLFGRTRAYFGMVESQGRGTLHIHFLIWIAGLPKNARDYRMRLDHQEGFVDELVKFADSIVTTKMPIALDALTCPRCSKKWQLEARPLTADMRKNNPTKTNVRLEPILVECKNCAQPSSSQHVFRQLLVQRRPRCWPLPVLPMSREEYLDEINLETRASRSYTDACAGVHAREMYLAIAAGSDTAADSEELLHLFDKTQQGYVRPDDDPFRGDSYARWIEMTPPSPLDKRLSPADKAYLLSSLVINLNTHWWAHTGSCFKKSVATSSADTCRYGFPRERQADTAVNNGVLTVGRHIGHEFVNGYNPTIMRTFKSNHDVQVIFGGEAATNRIHYCCKYVTKSQRFIDCESAVALASFERRVDREATDTTATPADAFVVSRQRLSSMTYTFTNKQEVAGPLAALDILRGSCCYASDDTARLPLGDILHQLVGSDYTCNVVQCNDTGSSNMEYRSASALDDYVYRPLATENASLYQHTMSCYRKRLSSTRWQDHAFLEGHPLRRTHGVSFRRRKAVPIISGPRLPNLTTDSGSDQRETYGKIALTLFKPFRRIEDLVDLDDGGTWYDSYLQWKDQRTPFVQTIMFNMEDIQTGMTREETGVVSTSQDSSDTEGSEPDGYVSDDASISSGVDQTFGDVFFNDLFLSASSTSDSIAAFPVLPAYSERVQQALSTLTQLSFVSDDAADFDAISTSSIRALSPVALKAWVSDASSDNSQLTCARASNTSNSAQFCTRVEELLQEDISWTPPPYTIHAPQTTPQFGSIQEISRKCGLNRKQHAAFASIARKNLLRRKSRESPTPQQTLVSDETIASEQLLFYLGGEGGTGKSRVIGALKEFYSSWHRNGALVICAMTGKAASLVGGRTLASFECALKGAHGYVEIEQVDCIVIDEVSMMSKYELLQLDKLLRKATRVQGVRFGGISIVLAGDFFQLPPVGADPIYINPTTKRQPTLTDVEGFQLWREFDTVIILDENMRFRRDPAWGKGCSEARVGLWTPSFISLINSRLVASGERQETYPDRTFVTPDNETRAAVNDLYIRQATENSITGRLPVRVVANYKGALVGLSRQHIELIMSLPDNKFGRMAPFLDFIPGMPVQVTQNIRTRKGVANGTIGKLHSVHFPNGTTYTRTVDRRSGVTVLLPSHRPVFALLDLERGCDAKPIMEGLHPRLFPVFPDTEAYEKAQVRLSPAMHGDDRVLKVRIQQFPFVCAMGATVYKVQGESLQSMAVVDWKSETGSANKPQQPYLMVSRVVTRESLIIFRPFTEAIAHWARPPPQALAEEERLRTSSIETERELAS